MLVGGAQQFPGAVDHDRVDLTSAGAHVDRTVGRVPAAIVPGLPATHELPALGHRLDGSAHLGRVAEEGELVVAERHLPCGAAQVRLAHVRVRRVDHGRFGGLVEQILGMVHEVLVERIVLSDEHGERVGVAPPGSPRLLPHRRAGPGVAREHGGVERPDVDAELERARRGDRQQLAVGERAFDPSPILREVAGPVARDLLPQLRVADLAPRPLGEQLRRPTRSREADRSGPAALASCPRSQALSARALRRAPVSSSTSGGFQRAKSFSPDGEASSVISTTSSRPVSRLASSPRVPDGRAREAPPRGAAVVRDEAPQPSQHHRDVRTEHAAAHVGLVDDHERQSQEEVGPARVVGEQRQVQHVGVRHHEVRVRSDQGALRLRRVAVVDGGLDLRQLQGPHRAQLVARERLRREQVERGGLRRGDRRLGEGRVVHEGLAARGAGGHHHVAARPQRREAVGLVRVEAAHARQAQPGHEQLGQVGGERLDDRPACRQDPHVHEGVAHVGIGLEVPQERRGVHGGRLPAAGDGGAQTWRRAASASASASRSRASSS